MVFLQKPFKNEALLAGNCILCASRFEKPVYRLRDESLQHLCSIGSARLCGYFPLLQLTFSSIHTRTSARSYGRASLGSSRSFQTWLWSPPRVGLMVSTTAKASFGSCLALLLCSNWCAMEGSALWSSANRTGSEKWGERVGLQPGSHWRLIMCNRFRMWSFTLTFITPFLKRLPFVIQRVAVSKDLGLWIRTGIGPDTYQLRVLEHMMSKLPSLRILANISIYPIGWL